MRLVLPKNATGCYSKQVSVRNTKNEEEEKKPKERTWNFNIFSASFDNGYRDDCHLSDKTPKY